MTRTVTPQVAFSASIQLMGLQERWPAAAAMGRAQTRLKQLLCVTERGGGRNATGGGWGTPPSTPILNCLNDCCCCCFFPDTTLSPCPTFPRIGHANVPTNADMLYQASHKTLWAIRKKSGNSSSRIALSELANCKLITMSCFYYSVKTTVVIYCQ